MEPSLNVALFIQLWGCVLLPQFSTNHSHAQDVYTLPELQKVRRDHMTAVGTSLQEVSQYVVAQIQGVGTAVLQALTDAQAAVAKLTRKQARLKRFEAPGKGTWKTKSPALAREAEVHKGLALDAARADRDKFRRFLLLVDQLVVAQMAELARLAIAIALHHFSLHRRLGLLMVKGELMEVPQSWPEGDMAGPGLARISSISKARGTLDVPDPRASGLSQLALGLSQSQVVEDVPTPGHDTRSSRNLPYSLGAPSCSHFNPTVEELTKLIVNVPKEVLAVVASASQPVSTFLEVRQLLRELLGSGLAWDPAQQQRSQDSPSSSRSNQVLDLLSKDLHVAKIQADLEERVTHQYRQVLRHFNLKPYMGHMEPFKLVVTFHADKYSGCAPDVLHRDLQVRSEQGRGGGGRQLAVRLWYQPWHLPIYLWL